MNPIKNLNLKLLQTFLLVAEHNNFRQAAELAHRSQSAISSQIKQLEEQLGVALFHRTTRRVRLTDEGLQLLGSAQRAIHEVELGLKRIREAADIRSGRISISCSPTIAASRLPRVLAAFEDDYPGVQVFVREAATTVVFENVRIGEADFGVAPFIKLSGFAFEPILDDDLYALVPKNLVRGSRSTITFKSLAAMPLLVLDATTALRATVEETMRRNGMAFSTKHEFNQVQTLISMARVGLGAAVLPKTVLPSAPDARVKILRIVAPTLTRRIGIITNRGQKLSPAAARLAQHLRELVGVESDE